MKKIININLSGRVIPIEDSAYEKLQSYINSLRRYFANEEGRDEIINDIESRIAELMSDKIKKGATSVTDSDIEEIISSMGRVEDFEAVAEEEGAAGQEYAEQNTYARQKQKRRLHRDENDKFIGGVCSGLAAYMNVDPTIVRILFAIVTFGGFGLGFLIYILLWIFLPVSNVEGYTGKRLYRNPDDKMLGGVAGGLAAYFQKSSSLVRLIFATPILFSILMGILNTDNWHNDFIVVPNIVFGSLTGTFILIYVVLWIVLPEAHSTYEKMEMRGEKVDVNSIRQNVQEGMGNMKDRMKTWGEEVKETAQNLGNKAKEFSNTKGKAFASEFGETARRTGNGIGHAFAVLFKVFFLFIAGTIAFAIFVSLIAMLFGGIAWWPVNNFLWTSKWQQLYAWGTLIFFILVPLIAFITWIVRRITRTRSGSSYLGWLFGGLWTLGWVALMLFITSMTKDFRELESVDEPVAVSQPTNNKMIVAVSQPELEYYGRFNWINDDAEGWDLSDDTLKIGSARFNVIASKNDQYQVITKKYSFGSSVADATKRAGRIQFDVRSADSLLDIPNGYAIDKNSKFRGQYVEVEIQVPIGKKIRFDESVTEKLGTFRVDVKRERRRKRVRGVEISSRDYHFPYRTGIDYTMGVDGDLKDSEGNPATRKGDSNYRYEQKDSTATQQEIKQNIEKKKKELEELEEKMKKIEQKKTTSAMKNKLPGQEEYVAGIPTPVSSLVQWF